MPDITFNDIKSSLPQGFHVGPALDIQFLETSRTHDFKGIYSVDHDKSFEYAAAFALLQQAVLDDTGDTFKLFQLTDAEHIELSNQNPNKNVASSSQIQKTFEALKSTDKSKRLQMLHKIMNLQGGVDFGLTMAMIIEKRMQQANIAKSPLNASDCQSVANALKANITFWDTTASDTDPKQYPAQSTPPTNAPTIAIAWHNQCYCPLLLTDCERIQKSDIGCKYNTDEIQGSITEFDWLKQSAEKLSETSTHISQAQAKAIIQAITGDISETPTVEAVDNGWKLKSDKACILRTQPNEESSCVDCQVHTTAEESVIQLCAYIKAEFRNVHPNILEIEITDFKFPETTDPTQEKELRELLRTELSKYFVNGVTLPTELIEGNLITPPRSTRPGVFDRSLLDTSTLVAPQDELRSRTPSLRP